jgi:uncharacterized protein YjlB
MTETLVTAQTLTIMSPRLAIASISSPNPTVVHTAAHASFPNSDPSGLPVVHYSPFSSTEILGTSAVEEIVRKHGFQPAWRYVMLNFDHFHSTCVRPV